MDSSVAGQLDDTAAQESARSAVSWAAVIAGAVVTMAIALLIVTLGAGLGLTSLSPWPNTGTSTSSFGIMTGVGLIFVHWIASASGGYITGRLRTKWVGTHTHEVFFRDTAHGLLTWSVATLTGAVLLTSVVSSVVGGSVHAVGTVAASTGAAAQQQLGGVSAYDVDSLFRSERPDPTSNPQASTAQASQILASGLATGDVPAADRSYLSQLVSARTGLSQADAQKRVDDVIAKQKAAETKLRQAAEAARKAAAELAIFTALAMLIGAFIASAAAAYGGSQRDQH